MKASRTSAAGARWLPWLVGGAAAAATGAAALKRRNGNGANSHQAPEAPAVPEASQAPMVPRAPEMPPSSGYRNNLPWRAFNGAAQVLDNRFGWDRLPLPIGYAVLFGLRNLLRQRNLYDTGGWAQQTPPPWDAKAATERTSDGSYNDLQFPAMGMARTRFGRNVPIEQTRTESDEDVKWPSPRTVSTKLLQRREFLPATSVNLLVASWIQFMVKDWFSHGEGDPDRVWEIELEEGDPWPDPPFRILKTLTDETHKPGEGRPTTFLNTATHWWDGSQIYGTNIQQQHWLRTHKDGKLRLGPDGLLVLPEGEKDFRKNPAMIPGWWVGLNMMANLFVREHNAVCDRLKADYPHWDDEQLFQRARLVVCALLAKIHTVEWTPAILAHPTTISGIRAEWWGLAGERVRRTFGRIGRGEILSGVPGSTAEQYGVPYSLTEEFTIVYRMHPLIPDHYVFRSARDHAELSRKELGEITGPAAQDLTRQISMTDLFYSFGVANPGQIVLHNLPTSLVQFTRPDGHLMDVGATDILRAREFGVPRYNQFRRLLRMKPAKTFEELTGGDTALAEEIRSVYENQIERVDLMVGMFAEPRPEGFAFSETAFRIFLLMAARRLNSDRFLTNDFNKTVYTPAGMDWVQSNDMISVLLRHFPDLAPAMHGKTNAFHPWDPVTQPSGPSGPGGLSKTEVSARASATARRSA